MSDTSEDNWRPFGNCSIRFEPPDLIATRLSGQISATDVSLAMAEVDRVAGERGRLFSVCDASRGSGITAEARRVFADYSPNSPLEAVGIYGASFQMRIFLKLLVAANELLHSSRRTTRLKIFATEAEARAWIEERRLAFARENAR